MKKNPVNLLLLAMVTLTMALPNISSAQEPSSSPASPKIPAIPYPLHLHYTTVNHGKQSSADSYDLDFWLDGTKFYLDYAFVKLLQDRSDVRYEVSKGFDKTLYIYPPTPKGLHGSLLKQWQKKQNVILPLGFQFPGMSYISRRSSLRKTATGWKEAGIVDQSDLKQNVMLTYDQQGRLTDYYATLFGSSVPVAQSHFADFRQITPGIWIPTKIIDTFFTGTKTSQSGEYLETRLQSYSTKTIPDATFSVQNPQKGTFVFDFRYILPIGSPVLYQYSGKSSVDAESAAQFRQQKIVSSKAAKQKKAAP